MKKNVYVKYLIMTILCVLFLCTCNEEGLLKKQVHAEEVEVLTLNQGLEVSGNGDEKEYTFTAEIAGKYYFYTYSERGSRYPDMYGKLVTENNVYENDDNEYITIADFLIEAELAAGEECTLVIHEYRGDEYNTTLYVSDESFADGILFITSDKVEHIAEIGEAVTFETRLISIIGNTVESLSDEYTVSWELGYRYGSNEDTYYEEDGLALTIPSVEKNMFETAYNDSPYFAATLYNNEKEVNYVTFCVCNEDMVYEVPYFKDLYVNKNKTMTLEAEAYNYLYDGVDLSDDKYTFEWYREKEFFEENEAVVAPVLLDSEEHILELNVTKEDLYNESSNIIVCYIYEYDTLVGSTLFYLNDKETYIEGKILEEAVRMGDSIELNAKVIGYDGNEIELDRDKYYVEWVKYELGTSFDDTVITTVSNDYTYVIDNITNDDVYNPGRGCKNVYTANIYRYEDDELVAYCEVKLCDVEYTYYGETVTVYVNIGENVDFAPSITDFYGEKTVISGSEFSFQWMKVTEDEYWEKNYESAEVLGNTPFYVIKNIVEEDLQYVYLCDVYKNDEYVATCYYRLKDIDKCFKVETDVYEVAVGDTLTMEVKLYDYYGNEVELSGEDYIICWKFIRRNEVVGYGPEYTIESVSEKDFAYYSYMFYEDMPAYTVKVYTADKEPVGYANVFIYENEPAIEETTVAEETSGTKTENTTAGNNEATNITTKAPETTKCIAKKPAKVKIKKVFAKKKASKKIKISLKSLKGASGYEIQIAKGKKFTKKNILVKRLAKKNTVVIKNKKIAGKKYLFIRARAYSVDSTGKKIFGVWSKVKKIKTK